MHRVKCFLEGLAGCIKSLLLLNNLLLNLHCEFKIHFSALAFLKQIGKGRVLIEGRDIALLGYGAMVQNCLRAQSLLSKLGIEVTVADARFCKPLDIQLVRQLCENHAFLITVEEGAVGGFGSHVAQFITLDGQLDGKIKVIFY